MHLGIISAPKVSTQTIVSSPCMHNIPGYGYYPWVYHEFASLEPELNMNAFKRQGVVISAISDSAVHGLLHPHLRHAGIV